MVAFTFCKIEMEFSSRVKEKPPTTDRLTAPTGFRPIFCTAKQLVCVGIFFLWKSVWCLVLEISCRTEFTDYAKSTEYSIYRHYFLLLLNLIFDELVLVQLCCCLLGKNKPYILIRLIYKIYIYIYKGNYYYFLNKCTNR